jgi:hypothetical protein
VAYYDDSTFGYYKATVMKYDSGTSSWVTVGTADFSDGGA